MVILVSSFKHSPPHHHHAPPHFTTAGMEGSKPSLTSAPSNASMTSMGGREVNQDLCNVPGFVALNWLLCQHSDVTEVNFLVLMLLLNQSVVDVPSDAKVGGVEVMLCYVELSVVG